jgi:hypothetical protein
MGFRELSSVALLPRGSKPTGLCLLLPVEQWEPWVLLTQGCKFPWHFRVKGAGCVVWGSMELQVAECARKQDLPPSAEWWSLELCGDFSGRGSGVLSCESFFPFFPWLVASLVVNSDRDLLLAGYGTPWVPFGFFWSSFFKIVAAWL